MMFYVSTIPLTQKAIELCSKRALTFKSSIMFQLYFSYWIFSKIVSYFHKTHMSAARARGTNGNLFPLCRSTAFKLGCEESINKRQSVGSCWFPRACLAHQISVQYTRSFSWEKKFLDFILAITKKHISQSWWRRLRPFSLEPEFSLFFRQIKFTDKVVKMSLR